MSNAIFGFDNSARTAAISASASAAGLGPEQMQNPHGAASTSWQTPSGTTTAHVVLDAGSAVGWDAFGVFNSNLTPSAGVRWRVGAREAIEEESALVSQAMIDPAWTLPAGATFTRPHTPSTCFATVRNASGVWVEVAANTLRIAHSETGERQGLLFETDRTNSIRNPRAEGAAVGTPGTAPTNWTVNAGGTGLSSQIVGVGTANGLPFIDIRFFGTATSGGSTTISPETSTGITAATGARWTFSAFHQIVGGSLAGIDSTELVIEENTSTGVFVTSGAVSATPTSSMTRATHTRTLSGGATVARVLPIYRHQISSGAVVDLTVRLFALQMELGEFATTPMLPPVGSPQTSRRGFETLTFTSFAGLSAGTLYLEQVIEIASTVSTQAAGVQADDGTSNNRVLLRAVGGTIPAVDVIVNVGGVVVLDGVNNAPITVDVLRRDAVRFGSNSIRQAFNGTLYNGQTTNTPTNLTRIMAQSNARGTAIFRAIRLYSAALSDGQLAALTSSGSTITAATYDSGTLTGTVAAGYRQSLHIAPTQQSGRYVRVDINDPTNPEGRLRVAQMFAGRVVRPVRNIGFDSAFAREAEAPAVVTRGGQQFPTFRYARRSWRVSLPSLDAADVWTLTQALQIAAQDGSNVLFIPFPTGANVAREAVFGTVSGASGVGWPSQSPAMRAWAATITERL